MKKVDYFEYMFVFLLFFKGAQGAGTDSTELCSNTSVTKKKQNNYVHCLYRIKTLHEAS